MRVARLGTILLLALPACGGITGGEDLGDGGGRSFEDGGGATGDAGADIDAAPVPSGMEDPGTPGACYDGVDNDADDFQDCADDACSDDIVCCVGSATCCTPAGVITLSIPATCRDTAFADCVGLDSALSAFGTVAPDFEGGRLVPQGGSSYGGVALGGAIDPRTMNVVLSSQIVVPDVRCADCIDAAGIGFFEAVPAGDERAIVRVGVLVNGGRQQVQILVADRPVQTEPLAPGTLTVSIELSIEGRAIVRGIPGAAEIVLEGVELPAALTPVVFGRTDNRAGEAAVSVGTASASIDRCDVPGALTRRAAPVLPATSSPWTPTALGRVAHIDLGSVGAPRPRLVFAHAGDLLVAGPNGFGELVGSSGPPDLLLTPPTEYEALHDPWLLRDAELVELFVVGERATDGKRELMRATGTAGTTLTVGALSPVAVPPQVESIEGPTVWIEDHAAGIWRMIARVDTGSGGRLVAMVSNDGGGRFEWATGELESSVVLAPSPDDVFAIARDEVADPALVRVGDTWRLYYAARRGQRWSIGLLVSGTGDVWRPLGPVLEGDGAGFDALGVRSPAPVVRVEGDVQLHYLGTDGTREALGLAGPAGTLGE